MLDIEFLVAAFFFFQHLNMLPHCILVFMFSGEKLAVNLIEDLLYMFSHFSLDAFFLVLDILNRMYLNVDL